MYIVVLINKYGTVCRYRAGTYTQYRYLNYVLSFFVSGKTDTNGEVLFRIS
jgi:hypothetical protein